MERTDEPAIANPPPRGGTKIGAQMWANGLSDADAPVLVVPDDNVLPIHVFCVSLAASTDWRLATKYHPSGNGGGDGALVDSPPVVGIS